MKKLIVALCVLGFSSVAFAQTKTIDQLGTGTAPTGQEYYPVFQGSNPAVKLQGQSIAAMVTNFVDPILSYNAAGVITATTGTISSSSKTLIVASATGWSVGMGIAVANAGSGGNTELITYVDVIVGTTFTLHDAAVTTATTQAVNHDDTRAINAAITAASAAPGNGVHLRCGGYHVTSTLTVNTGISFVGDGGGCSVIWNRSKTANVFTIGYTMPGGGTYSGIAALFSDFQISQKSGITPSAGYGFAIAGAAGSPANYVTNLHIKRINMNNLWGGIHTGNFQLSNWFTEIYMDTMVGGYGVVHDSASPSGDDHYINIEMSGPNTGFQIINADTFEITGLKTNQSGLVFTGGTVLRVRIINPSIEGDQGAPSIPACGIEFGTTGTLPNVQVIGGGIGLITTLLCHKTNVTGLELIGTEDYTTGHEAYMMCGATGLSAC